MELSPKYNNIAGNPRFQGKDLSGEPAEDFSNYIIKGLNLAQEFLVNEVIPPEGGKHVLPAETIGAVFDGCNLDGVYVPPGNTVLPSCCHRTIQVQNDLLDWEMEKPIDTWKPKMDGAIEIKRLQRLGLSTDPADIPAEKVDVDPITAKENEVI